MKSDIPVGIAQVISGSEFADCWRHSTVRWMLGLMLLIMECDIDEAPDISWLNTAAYCAVL